MFKKNSTLTLVAIKVTLGMCASVAVAGEHPCSPDFVLSSSLLEDHAAEAVLDAHTDLVVEADSAGVLVIDSAAGGLALRDGVCGAGASRLVIEEGTRRLALAFDRAGEHGFRLSRSNGRAGWVRAHFIPALVTEHDFEMQTHAGQIWVRETRLHALEPSTSTGSLSWPEGPPGTGRHLVSLFALSHDGDSMPTLSMVSSTRHLESVDGRWLESGLRFRVHGNTSSAKDFPEVDPDPDGLTATCAQSSEDFPEVDPDPDGLTATCAQSTKDFPEVDPDPDGLTATCAQSTKDFPEVDPDPDGLTATCAQSTKDFPEVDPDPDGLTATCAQSAKDFPEVDPDPDGLTATCAQSTKDFPEVDPDPDGLTATCAQSAKDFPEVDPDPDGLTSHSSPQHRIQAELLRPADVISPVRHSIEWVVDLLWPELGVETSENQSIHRLERFD